LIDAAVSRGLVDLHGLSTGEASWRMLSAMLVIELRLENLGDTDRTTAVARLHGAVREGSTQEADALFNALLALILMSQCRSNVRQTNATE
ncbi:MAG: hypothetical protein ACXWAV_05715, partial [Chthoniobacterales bacterium]